MNQRLFSPLPPLPQFLTIHHHSLPAIFTPPSSPSSSFHSYFFYGFHCLPSKIKKKKKEGKRNPNLYQNKNNQKRRKISEKEKSKMAIDDHHPIDDKTRRMRDLLSSFYAHDPSIVVASNSISLDAINTSSFDSEKYMELLVKKSNLEGLLQKHVEMAAEIKNLDTDLQMLVYENYNKFVSATETIKRMKNNIVGMESNMEQLLEKIMSVQSKSDVVNTSLFAKREHIEKLHHTRNLLRKVQFIYDLPARLGKFIKAEAYGSAVKFYTGAMPIFKTYGDSSFHDCKKASEEAMDVVIRNLQEKILSESETTEARAEALVLLKQLDFPVDNLQSKLLERLEHFEVDLESEIREVETATSISDKPSMHGNSDTPGVTPSEARKHKASIHEFAEAVRAHRVMFSDSETQLIELSLDMFTRHYKTVQQRIQEKASSTDLLALLRIISVEVTMMDEVLPQAVLQRFSLEAAHGAIKQYVASTFSHLLNDIAEALLRARTKSKEKTGEDHSLQLALGSSKRAVIQGSMDALLDFRQLLDENLGLLVKLRNFIIDWVQEGFQEFFRSLHVHFLEISETNTSTRQHQGSIDGTQRDKVLAGLVLVLAQLSVFIEESAIQRIAEEIAASFSGGGGFRSNEDGPAFVPGEICRAFRSAGEKFLHLYVNIKTQKLSILLRKRFTAPNWTKHKEPRDVHMFVDLLLQEMEEIRAEVKQILSRGLNQKHVHSLSNGSNSSSRGNAIRDDKISPSNSHRARSQFLETHLALLFKQKMEIFTRLEYTQESVVSTIVKLFLKSLQEFVRMQTFNRSGFQQIQLDIQFLRAPLKETVEDEATIDFLLDEIIMSAAERCLDPISLEPAILDRLIQAKLTKRGEHSPTST